MSCICLALRQSGVMRDNDRLKHLSPDELCWIQSGYSPITVFSDDPYYTASIALELERGRYDGVGKARDRHKRTGSGEARDIVIKPQPREQRTEKYERDRNRRSGALRVQPDLYIRCILRLSCS